MNGDWKTRSAPSIRTKRWFGCSSWIATWVISPSTGTVPEWFATTRPLPSAGMFSMPRTSTRNQRLYSGRSNGIQISRVNSSSKPKSSIA